MGKSIQVGNLLAALSDALTVYAQDVIDRINDVGEQSSDKLRRITRATAPRSNRRCRQRNEAIYLVCESP